MVRIIAHRGSSIQYPENSLAAFKHAITHGADSLEVDLRRSRDGVIYCFHDYRLDRLTGRGGYFRLTESQVLDSLKLKSKEPLLRFDQFVRNFGGKAELILDIKSAGIESEILQTIASQRLFGSTIFSSFNQKVLSVIKLLAPKARTALIAGPVRNLKMKINLKSHLVRTLKKLRCSDIHLSERISREPLVTRLMESGFTVAVWTVDDIEKGRSLIEYGVDGIITNNPLVMRDGVA